MIQFVICTCGKKCIALYEMKMFSVIDNEVLDQLLKPNVLPNGKKISKKFAFQNRALMYEMNTHNITGARS